MAHNLSDWPRPSSSQRLRVRSGAGPLRQQPELLPLHQALMAVVRSLGTDIEIAPKKGYLSLRRRKRFGMIKPAARHVDLGLILAGQGVGGRLESTATFNALFTHRVRIGSSEDIDDELRAWIGQAYAEAG